MCRGVDRSSFQVPVIWLSFYIRRKLFHPSPSTRFIHRLCMCISSLPLPSPLPLLLSCAAEMQLCTLPQHKLRYGVGLRVLYIYIYAWACACRTATTKTIKFNVIALQLLLKFYYGINIHVKQFIVHAHRIEYIYIYMVMYMVRSLCMPPHIERNRCGRCLSHCRANNNPPFGILHDFHAQLKKNPHQTEIGFVLRGFNGIKPLRFPL